jgi:hypothetical protein
MISAPNGSHPAPPKRENPQARLTLVKHLGQYREFRRIERGGATRILSDSTPCCPYLKVYYYNIIAFLLFKFDVTKKQQRVTVYHGEIVCRHTGRR